MNHIHGYLTNPRFMAVLEFCLGEEEFIQQFERLSQVKRPPARNHPIEKLVDDATGFTDSQWFAFFEKFIPFVYECVWLTWKERDNEKCWSTDPHSSIT